jgi:hypothetical protein
MPDMAAVTGAWSAMLAELPIPVRSKWRGGNWADATDAGLRFEVPNEWHQKACEEGRTAVENVLKAQFGLQVPVEVVVAGGAGGGGGAPAAGGGPARPAGPSGGPPMGNDPGPEDEDMSIDVSELADAHDVAVGGVDLLMREFGGELIQEDP